MPTWSNAGSLPPGSLPRNISAKSSAIAIFGHSPSFLEENENPTPTPRRWRNMKLSRSQPSPKPGTPSLLLELPRSRQVALRVQRCSEIVHRRQGVRIRLAQQLTACRQHLLL